MRKGRIYGAAIHKLRSGKGASITFALMVFLVASIASSIVIVAGTASSGRMSRLMENEQKYYSVTSAAELLKDMIQGKTVILERTQVWEEVNTYRGGSTTSGTPKKVSDTAVFRLKEEGSSSSEGTLYGTITTVYEADGTTVRSTQVTPGEVLSAEASTPALTILSSFLTEAAQKLVETPEIKENTEFINAYPSGALTGEYYRTMLLKPGLEENSVEMVAFMKERIQPDGSLVFSLVDTTKASSGEGDALDGDAPGGDGAEGSTGGTGTYEVSSIPYHVSLVFECDRRETSGENTVNGEQENISMEGDVITYRYHSTITKVTTTQLSWALVDIQTTDLVVTSTPAPTPTPESGTGA